MTTRFVKHNPAFLEEEQLIENFVVRQVDFELIKRIIGDHVPGSRQHLLVTGARGSGKTLLVHRIAAEIERHDELYNRFYPLIFSEESYQVSSAAEFWLESLFCLGRQTGDEQWKQAYLELRSEIDDQLLCERALQHLLDFADSAGKEILLIVENLNMLFGDLASAEEGATIRQTLMNQPQLLLLATATSLFEGIDHPSSEMFEMFMIHELKPLDDDECNVLWGLIAGEKLPGEQIRSVRILTRGNPRMLTLFARCGAKRPFRLLFDNLVVAIDEYTGYFKSHLDTMAPIERKVYLALAELWSISSVREIALVARLDVNKTSAYLNRLLNRGVVVIEKQAKRNKLYGLTESSYSIYYHLRRYGRLADRVRALAKFMINLYDPLPDKQFPGEEGGMLLSAESRGSFTAFEEAVMSVPDRKHFQQCRDHFAAAEAVVKSCPVLPEAVKNIRVDERMFVFNGGAAREDDVENKVLEEGFNHAFGLLEAGNYSEALHVFEAIIMVHKSSAEDQIAVQVAGAMFGKGVALGNMNRPEVAVKTYEELITTYKGRFEALLVMPVVMAMFSKGCELAGLNRPEEAIEAYEEVIAACKDSSEEQIVKWVVKAIFSKAVLLGELNRRHEVLQLYEELLDLFKECPDAEVAEQVAKCMIHKGVTLGDLNSRDEEIQTYEELVTLYKERSELQILEHVVSALFNKGIVLDSMNRWDEAMQAYEELIATYKERPEKQIVVKVSNAIFNKGVVYGKLDRYQEAERAFMKAMELSPQGSRAQFVLLKLLMKMQERQNEALELAGQYVGNPDLVESTIEGAIMQFVKLAALGYAPEALSILVGSPAEKHLEPLVAALRLYTDEEVRSAVEILEVAKDVVKKIEERQRIMN
ncbi:MAG: tetratricopeptide repeat protein [Chlorobiaceae bacterium]